MRCTGCDREFTESGFAMHAMHTSSVLCRNAYRELVIQAALEEQDQNGEDPDMPIAFRGDYFGDYDETEFQWPDNHRMGL
jgi:hypothetical protein